jgi:flagellar FliL protein
MAEPQDKTVVEKGDKKEEKSQEQPAASGSKKFLMLGMVGLGAIVLGVTLAIFVVKPMMSKSSTPEEPKKTAEHKGEAAKDGEHVAPPEGTIYTIKDIVVNPANTGGTRFLSVSFAFEIKSPELAGQLQSKELMVRDALITILSAKTVAQLTDPKEKEIVRYQIRKRISDILKTDKIAAVYYTDFVLQ